MKNTVFKNLKKLTQSYTIKDPDDKQKKVELKDTNQEALTLYNRLNEDFVNSHPKK